MARIPLAGPGFRGQGVWPVRRFGLVPFAVLTCWLWPADGQPHQAAQPRAVPAPYTQTRDQAGHEFVKTEQFVVPVGEAVIIEALQFEALPCELTTHQKRVLQQVFNSLEEITENTVGDTDPVRIAEFAGMAFEITAYSRKAGKREQDAAAQQCASVARDHLTNLGTPPRRLTTAGVGAKAPGVPKSARPGRGFAVRVVFVRTK